MNEVENGKNEIQNSNVVPERYLSFSLGNEEFAIPLLKVKEVIGVPEVTSVPFTPPYFLGIMNLRGQIISVMDLRQKLGIKPVNKNETAVIICDFGHISLGVVVDSINSVAMPKPEELSDRPQMGQEKFSEFIMGVITRESRLTLILNIAKCLNVEDLKAIERSKSPKAA